ncbi:MAG: hypothetical protein WC412_08040 [Candidatus Omnitrophota bacterium]|jgi:hypothetical protein
MKINYLMIGFLMLGNLYFCGSVFSETLILKSGQTVEGKIIEETDKYVKIDFMGTFLTYSKIDIKDIDKSKETPVKIKIKPASINAKELLAKIELLEKDMGGIISKGYGEAMQVQGGKSASGYREAFQATAASIRSKVNEIKRLNVTPDCEKLKQLFVEVYDAQADQLVRSIDDSSTAEESEIRKKQFNKKKEQYSKEKDRIKSNKR